MHTKTPSVTIRGNITSTRYRNDVIRSVLLLHISANLGMMLARDDLSCHAARSTLVMFVEHNVHKMTCKSLDLNLIDHLLDSLKHKVRAQSLQLNLRDITRVIHQNLMCSEIPQQYIHIHILSINTRYLAADATPG